MELKTRVRLLKVGAWLLGLVPGARLVLRGFNGDLGANPIEEILHSTGSWALIILLVALAVTPVRIWTGWNSLQKVRRLLGLWGFAYVTAHFLIYLLIDQGLIFELAALEFVWEDIAERPFITVGFLAWVVLIPLAVTSTQGWIRRLGKRWTVLHRLAYVAAALGCIHYFWKVKADTRLPLVAIAVWLVLMAARLPGWMAKRSKRRGGPTPA